MSYQNILHEISQRTLYITINRPDKLNALNTLTISELNHVLERNRHNDDIQVVVITGSGQKAFVAGADISEFPDLIG